MSWNWKDLFRDAPTVTALAVQEPVVNLSQVPDPYEGFEVTYYPHSDRYYPRCQNEYGGDRLCFLRRISDINGKIDSCYSAQDAEFFKNEKGAWKFIDEMIMQRKHGTSVQIKKHPFRR